MTKRTVLAIFLAAAAGLAQTIDCLVAVVNGEIITLLDVQVTAEFGLGRSPAVEAGKDSKLDALDALIDRKVILDIAREARGVDAGELAAAVEGLRRGLGEDVFAAKLGKFGLVAKDLEPYLADRILCERALARRFSQTIPVAVTEVERHYRDIYSPERTRLGLEAEPFEKVAAAIESRIRDERRAQQTGEWVRDLRDRADIQLKKGCLE